MTLRICLNSHDSSKILMHKPYIIPILEDVLYSMKDVKFFKEANL